MSIIDKKRTDFDSAIVQPNNNQWILKNKKKKNRNNGEQSAHYIRMNAAMSSCSRTYQKQIE